MKLKIHEFQKNNFKLMSKTLKTIVFTIILSTITANAQITKGNWMVGGYANFSNTSYESTNSNGSTSSGKSNGLNISPTIGYFVANNFACGLSGNFGLSIPEQGSNATSYGVGPFVRYCEKEKKHKITQLFFKLTRDFL